MRSVFLFIGVLIVLSGCVSMNGDQYNETAMQRLDTERQALKQANDDVTRICAKGKDPKDYPRNQFVKFQTCAIDKYEAHVLPVALDPNLFRRLGAVSLENAELYKKGAISYAQFHSRMDMAYMDYREAVGAELSRGLEAAQAKDRAINRSLLDASASTSVQTTCQSYGNRTSCNSW